VRSDTRVAIISRHTYSHLPQERSTPTHVGNAAAPLARTISCLFSFFRAEKWQAMQSTSEHRATKSRHRRAKIDLEGPQTVCSVQQCRLLPLSIVNTYCLCTKREMLRGFIHSIALEFKAEWHICFPGLPFESALIVRYHLQLIGECHVK
jgi:hypothetical protein